MKITLNGRVALVTGSSRGIGKEIAYTLAQAGAEVFITSRDLDVLKKTQEELRGSPGAIIHAMAADATDSNQVSALFEKIAMIGSLDILVNNAGGSETFGNFFTLQEADWQRAYNLNVMSTVYFSREAIPWLKKSHAGRIINIASIPAHQPGLFNPHYSAAKAALLNVSKHLANVLAHDNILVNTICPSTLKGGGWERNVRDRAVRSGVSLQDAEIAMEQEESAKSPLGRIGVPADVASLAVYLASDHANFITGHCFNIDGGITRSIL